MHSRITKTKPNRRLRNEEQPSVVAAVICGYEKRQQEDDDQRAHPENMVRDAGLVRQQHGHAQDGCCGSEDRIFTKTKRKFKPDDAGVEKGKAGDEERHWRQNERHQAHPWHTPNDKIRGGERQRKQHQLGKGIPCFRAMSRYRHQGPDHTKRDRNRPQTRFAQSQGLHGLT